MTIQSSLALADKHAKDKNMSDVVWALRVLAGAYRREKEITKKLKKEASGFVVGV